MSVPSAAQLLSRAITRLAQAEPGRLPVVLDALLRDVDHTAGAELLAVDYRMVELRSVCGPGRHPVDGSAAGQAFVTGRPVPEPASAGGPACVVTPVVVRGDRWGVVRLWGERVLPLLTDEDGAALLALAHLLGQCLFAAAQTTDAYRSARRSGPLTLTAEMQWDLLPGRALSTARTTVAGQLEPAHRVVGDVYDWVADADGLHVVVVDGSGAGTEGAQASALTVAAVRNARREGADLIGAARMADQALYARYEGSVFAPAVLLRLDAERCLEVVDAGGGGVFVGPRDELRRRQDEPQPPLGAEEDFPYHSHRLSLTPGDRVVVASDGLSGAACGAEVFGPSLERLLVEYRLLDAAEVVRGVIREMVVFHSGLPQADDAVVLCLDVH